MRSQLARLFVVGVALVAPTVAAHADPFGSATAAFNFDAPSSSEPSFSVGTTSGTLTLGDTFTVSSATGAMQNTAGLGGTSFGTLTFSTSIGSPVSVANSPTTFTFTDGTSTYTFTLTSIDTDSLSDSGGVTSLSLYLLGNLGTGTLSPTPTSVVLNYTGFDFDGSEINDNEALSNAPAVDPALASSVGGGNPVPEPMSFALLGAGLVATGAMRRFRSR